MLEKLITRVHGLMKLGDPKYIIQINIDNRHDEFYSDNIDDLSCVFIHYNQDGDRITTLSTVVLKTFDIFCERVNEYLDKLETINYKPKYKVGDIVPTSIYMPNQEILAVVKNSQGHNAYIIENPNGIIGVIHDVEDFDKYHILKE